MNCYSFRFLFVSKDLKILGFTKFIHILKECDHVFHPLLWFWTVQTGHVSLDNLLSSLAKSCPTLCDPMDCSTPGFPVLHYLPEFAQTHVHWVGDAIQPSHSLLPPFLLPFHSISSFTLSWLFPLGGQSIGASASASVLSMNIRVDFL